MHPPHSGLELNPAGAIWIAPAGTPRAGLPTAWATQVDPSGKARAIRAHPTLIQIMAPNPSNRQVDAILLETRMVDKEMYKNILIPVDFDHDEGTRKSFQVARLLADEDASFTVVHIVEAVPGYVRGQISDDDLQKRHDEMKQHLQKVAAGLQGAMPVLESGHAGHSIVSFAERNDIDCIILSSHTSRLEKFFIGSTANRVVNHAGCSVHVIR